MKKIIFSMILFMLMALLFCAAGTRIADINQQPRKFHNQIVTVSGTVTNLITLPILNVGIFQIDDGTGKIWVRPKQDTPYMNERIIVTGKLKVGISIGGKDFGVIIFESDDEE